MIMFSAEKFSMLKDPIFLNQRYLLLNFLQSDVFALMTLNYN